MYLLYLLLVYFIAWFNGNSGSVKGFREVRPENNKTGARDRATQTERKVNRRSKLVAANEKREQ